MAIGIQHGTLVPYNRWSELAIRTSQTNQALGPLNAGWAAVFQAHTTKDIIALRVFWSAVTAAGDVTIRIETVDAATGKPTGNLYDANAVLAGQVPATSGTGGTLYTFATPPTTGLVVGNLYALVIITTTGGTTHTLGGSMAYGHLYPYAMFASDATTRSNFAIVGTGAVPICSFVLEDDSVETFGCCPLAQRISSGATGAFGTRAYGSRVVVPTTIVAYGVMATALKTGTPAGDARIRVIRDGDLAAAAIVDLTYDKDPILLTGQTAQIIYAPLPTPLVVQPGVYRIFVTSAASADSSNCYQNLYGRWFTGTAPSGIQGCTTADITANPIVWTDSTEVNLCYMAFIADQIYGGVSRSRGQ